jgi:CRP-like cAMP-binding protein
MEMKPATGRLTNRLLATLPKADFERLQKQLEPVYLKQGELLIEPGKGLSYAYFPLDAMISLVSLLEDGSTVEAGCVGREGVVGVPLLLGASTTPMQSVVQIPGNALRMKADILVKELQTNKALLNILLLYLHVLIIFISQTAACNKKHPIVGRLARWLLLSSDCVDSEELPLTHEFLATMLGVRRAGVTETANELRSKGLIDYYQGKVTIVNRQGLEATACECYRVVRRELQRLNL